MKARDQRLCCLRAFSHGLISPGDLDSCLDELEALSADDDTECVLLKRQLLTPVQLHKILPDRRERPDGSPDGPRERPAALCETTEPMVRHGIGEWGVLTGFTLGRYKVLKRLGRGGMGDVYKALDTRLDCFVCLKMLLAGELATGDQIERFKREARSAARLQHPSIVRMHDLGEFPGRGWFLVMDYVEGKPLSQLLQRREVSLVAALDIAIQMADALRHAHAHGVIHRDVKPGNILVGSDGQPFLADFGLARRLDADEPVTRPNTAMGTWPYMPPELVANDGGEPDSRSDVYSLGATLYEMVTGHRPFAGSPAAIAQQILTRMPPTPSSLNEAVPNSLDEIILKALEKDPEKRWQTAAGLRDALRAERQKLTSSVPAWAARPKRRARLAVAMVILALTGIAAVGLYYHNRAERFLGAAAFLRSDLPRDRAHGLWILKQLGGRRAAELARVYIDPATTPEDGDPLAEEWALIRRVALEVVLHLTAPGTREDREELLSQAMDDPSPEVRKGAADLAKEGKFAKIPPRERLLGLLHGLSCPREDAQKVIRAVADGIVVEEGVELDDAVVDEILKMSAGAQAWIAGAVGELLPHAEAVGVLLRLVNGEYLTTVREAAVCALSELDGRAQLDTFARLARSDHDREVRRAAIEALGKLHEAEAPQAQDELRSLAAETNPSILLDVVSALGRRHTPEVVSRLLWILDERDGPTYMLVRAEVVACLGRFRVEQAVDPLGRLLGSGDEPLNVRRAAARALGEIAAAEAKRVLRDSLEREGAGPALGSVVIALGQARDHEAVLLLVELVEKNPPKLAALAAEALGSIGVTSDRVIRALAAAMRDHAGVDQVTYRNALDKLIQPPQFRIVVEMLSPGAASFQNEVYAILAEAPHARGRAALVEHGLGSQERRVREGSFQLLKRKVGQAFGYDPAAPEANRLEAMRKWRDWAKPKEAKAG